MAGLGYRLLSDPVRCKAPFIGADQGFFVSVGGGMATTLTSGSGLLLDPGLRLCCRLEIDLLLFLL